jgi:hypothetical protein
MVALIVVLTVVVVLLAVLVAGLLRSHADILRALHSLGAGVGDPALAGETAPGSNRSVPVPSPVTMGPPLPRERSSTSAPTVAGTTPTGDALALSVATAGRLTLLAFLSSGCSTCQGFWSALAADARSLLPPGVDVVVVTKGPELEVPADVAARAGGATVVMSSDAWTDYEVPASPFFVLVDGVDGRRIGEGIANTFSQVAELVRRAQLERGDAGHRSGHVATPTPTTGGDGPSRERANDHALRTAGVLPGDRSLYPTSLDDLYGPPDRDQAVDRAADGVAMGAADRKRAG